MLRERRWLAGVTAVAVIGIAACSDEDRQDLAQTAESVAEQIGDAAQTVVSNVRDAAGEAIEDTAELAVRNFAAEQGEEQFAQAGYPLNDEGLACQATVADGADAVDVSCTGTTEEDGLAELTGQTSELPGESITELEGNFSGTVDGAEIFTTDRLGS